MSPNNKAFVLTIPQIPSGTGTPWDIASESADCEIKFKSGDDFAIVFPPHYNGRGYTSVRSVPAAIRYHHIMNDDNTHAIMDRQGRTYGVEGSKLVQTP
jgi:hypothetical protein